MIDFIFAQAGGFAVASWAKWLILIAAIVAIVILAARYFGIEIPAIVLKIGGILLVAVLCIVAINFLMGIM